MNSLTVVESWIVSKLLANTSITSKVGQDVYLGVARDNNSQFYIRYGLVFSEPLYNLGTKRDFSINVYDIVAWKRGTDIVDLKTVANAIDDEFKGTVAATFQGHTFHSRTDRQLSSAEHTEAGISWRSLGATYRITATKI